MRYIHRVHTMKIVIKRLSAPDKFNRVFIKENILPTINGKALGDCSEIHHRFSLSFLIFGFPMGPVQLLLEDPPLPRLSIILHSPPLPAPNWHLKKKAIYYEAAAIQDHSSGPVPIHYYFLRIPKYSL